MDTLELSDQDPLEMLYDSVKAQRRLISGFGGNPKVPKEKFLDAQNPKHVVSHSMVNYSLQSFIRIHGLCHSME